MNDLDTMRCKHCDAIVALIPRRAIVGRFSLKCLHCGVVLVVWPPARAAVERLDKTVYTERVTATAT